MEDTQFFFFKKKQAKYKLNIPVTMVDYASVCNGKACHSYGKRPTARKSKWTIGEVNRYVSLEKCLVGSAIFTYHVYKSPLSCPRCALALPVAEPQLKTSCEGKSNTDYLGMTFTSATNSGAKRPVEIFKMKEVNTSSFLSGKLLAHASRALSSAYHLISRKVNSSGKFAGISIPVPF